MNTTMITELNSLVGEFRGKKNVLDNQTRETITALKEFYFKEDANLRMTHMNIIAFIKENRDIFYRVNEDAKYDSSFVSATQFTDKWDFGDTHAIRFKGLMLRFDKFEPVSICVDADSAYTEKVGIHDMENRYDYFDINSPVDTIDYWTNAVTSIKNRKKHMDAIVAHLKTFLQSVIRSQDTRFAKLMNSCEYMEKCEDTSKVNIVITISH